MTKSGLLQAVCTIAILAATPALAQSNNPTERARVPSASEPSGRAAGPGAYQPSNSPVGAMNQDHLAQAGSNTSTTPGQGNEQNGTSTAGNEHANMHRSSMGMSSRHAMRSERDTTAGDEAVDRLNDESLQAARKGQTFSASNATMGNGGGTSGSMNDMSGGSMNGNGGASSGSAMPGGSASGAGGGAGGAGTGSGSGK